MTEYLLKIAEKVYYEVILMEVCTSAENIGKIMLLTFLILVWYFLLNNYTLKQLFLYMWNHCRRFPSFHFIKIDSITDTWSLVLNPFMDQNPLNRYFGKQWIRIRRHDCGISWPYSLLLNPVYCLQVDKHDHSSINMLYILPMYCSLNESRHSGGAYLDKSVKKVFALSLWENSNFG